MKFLYKVPIIIFGSDLQAGFHHPWTVQQCFRQVSRLEMLAGCQGNNVASKLKDVVIGACKLLKLAHSGA
jgi:hypothetical protein